MSSLPYNQIVIGDARTRLDAFPASSIDCVITSPPYFQLRDYGTSEQIGHETSVDEWVEELRLVMRSLKRVLKPTGSLWLNLGDTYSRLPRHGAPRKCLLMGPERLALRLIEDGWYLRNKVIWHKRNTLPTAAGDRLACVWEPIYFFSVSRRYYFDLDAIRVPHMTRPRRASHAARERHDRDETTRQNGLANMKACGRVGHALGKNPGDVVRLSTSNFRGNHRATFPSSLVVQPLLATCPERVCVVCSLPWHRLPHEVKDHHGVKHAVRGQLAPSCDCQAGYVAGVVCDPFIGSGTVGVVAEAHRRRWVGIELNPDYAKDAEARIKSERRAKNGRQ